jgi:hypothetical protein
MKTTFRFASFEGLEFTPQIFHSNGSHPRDGQNPADWQTMKMEEGILALP